MGATEWVSIGVATLAALIAILNTFMTNNLKKKSDKNNLQLSEKIAELNIESNDKQRIIEHIAAQRIEWINTIRKHFVEFNSQTAKAHFDYSNLYRIDKTPDLEGLGWSILKEIRFSQLYLNENELVTRKLIELMFDVRSKLNHKNYDVKHYNSDLSNILFLQNVILKSEWRRVKEEIEKGESLRSERVKEIFDEVAKESNEGLYNFLIKSDD
ncbi:hypothetical protein [Jeotgalibacillus aurantiacus]|uniref:hypothetical protein n=1 Tax=Jeotgalibacillus aurantiacus TaxID=2763266 RepID=UPI001D09C396|nr:hypothetical protein [Jeotgalibacillus aurantiacus]